MHSGIWRGMKIQNRMMSFERSKCLFSSSSSSSSSSAAAAAVVVQNNNNYYRFAILGVSASVTGLCGYFAWQSHSSNCSSSSIPTNSNPITTTNTNTNTNTTTMTAKSKDGSAKFYIPTSENSNVRVFTGNSNQNLANEVAMYLGVQLGRAIVRKFSDGEVSVNILDNVRGMDTYIVQSISPPVNENLMELLLLISTLRRASAGKITAIIPYYGYARQELPKDLAPNHDSQPVTAADVAVMLEVMGVDRVVTVDLHHPQIQGLFDQRVPVDNLDVSGISIPYFETKNLKNPVVVSPDANGAVRARSFRDKLYMHGFENVSLAIVVDNKAKSRGWEKEQKKKGGVSVSENDEWTEEEIGNMNLVGDVKDRDCIIYDDIVDSGAKVSRASKKLKAAGARRIFVLTTHGLLSGDSLARIDSSEIVDFVCTNTIPLPHTRSEGKYAGKFSEKVHQLSVAALLAEVILKIHKNQSISDIFYK